LATCLMQGQRTFDCFGRLHARLDVQIAHESGVVGLERVVGSMVQLHAIRQAFTPAVRTHGIEYSRKLAAGFGKGVGLGGRRLKLDTNCTLHMSMVQPEEFTLDISPVPRQRAPSRDQSPARDSRARRHMPALAGYAEAPSWRGRAQGHAAYLCGTG